MLSLPLDFRLSWLCGKKEWYQTHFSVHDNVSNYVGMHVEYFVLSFLEFMVGRRMKWHHIGYNLIEWSCDFQLALFILLCSSKWMLQFTCWLVYNTSRLTMNELDTILAKLIMYARVPCRHTNNQSSVSVRVSCMWFLVRWEDPIFSLWSCEICTYTLFDPSVVVSRHVTQSLCGW